MGKLGEFEKEKMILGVIYSDEERMQQALAMLVEEFGEFDLLSDEFSFSREYSAYYDEELGGEGMRRIYSFAQLVDPADQAKIKTRTNEIEALLAVDGKRRVNLDPGFLNHGRLMLATTKGAGFRIPLSDGIYTELTLLYEGQGWETFPWTYRDYKSERVQDFLTRVRRKYLSQRREILFLEGKIQRKTRRKRKSAKETAHIKKEEKET